MKRNMIIAISVLGLVIIALIIYLISGTGEDPPIKKTVTINTSGVNQDGDPVDPTEIFKGYKDSAPTPPVVDTTTGDSQEVLMGKTLDARVNGPDLGTCENKQGITNISTLYNGCMAKVTMLKTQNQNDKWGQAYLFLMNAVKWLTVYNTYVEPGPDGTKKCDESKGKTLSVTDQQTAASSLLAAYNYLQACDKIKA